MSSHLTANKFHQEFQEEKVQLLLQCKTDQLCKLFKKLKRKQRLCTQHIWFNKQCRKFNIFPNYIQIKIKIHSRSSQKALNIFG